MPKMLLNDNVLIDPMDVSSGDISDNGIGAVLLLVMRPEGSQYHATRVVKADYLTRAEACAALRQIMELCNAAAPTRLLASPAEAAEDANDDPRAVVWLTAPGDRHGSSNALANNEADVELIADCGTNPDRWATELSEIMIEDAGLAEMEGWLSLWFGAAIEAGTRAAVVEVKAELRRETTEIEKSLREALMAEGQAAARAIRFLDDLSSDAKAAKDDIMSLRSVNLPVGDER